MAAPTSVQEALERIPAQPGEVIMMRMSHEGADRLAGISIQAASEFNSLLQLAADDLSEMKEIQTGEFDDQAIVKMSSIITSVGLSKLSALKQALSRLSDKDEEINARRARQLLAWLRQGKDAKSLENQLLVFSSKLEMIPSAFERSLRTPMSEWGSEIGELFSSGGGFSKLTEVFAGTPAEGIIEVVVGSLTAYLKLREQAKKMGRLKEDMQLQAVCYNRKTRVASQITQRDMASFKKAEETYRRYQANLQQLQNGGQKDSPEYYKELERLTRASEMAQTRFQKLDLKVRINPATVEDSLANLLQSLQTADSYGDNEVRLYQLSAQARQNALLRVNQLILVLSGLSSAYCRQVSAQNRLMQEKIMEDCRSILEFAVSGEFDKYLEPEDRKELLAINE